MTAGVGNAVFLEGPVTVETVPGLVEQIEQQLKRAASQVDFSHVTEIDSAAVALALPPVRAIGSRTVPQAA